MPSQFGSPLIESLSRSSGGMRNDNDVSILIGRDQLNVTTTSVPNHEARLLTSLDDTTNFFIAAHAIQPTTVGQPQQVILTKPDRFLKVKA